MTERMVIGLTRFIMSWTLVQGARAQTKGGALSPRAQTKRKK